MINKLIERLEQEEGLEQSEKMWCEKEMGVMTINLEKHSADSRAGQSNRELLSAELDRTKEQVQELTKKVKEAKAAHAERQKQRLENKAENTKVMKEAEEAAMAVENAIGVLQDYYNNLSLVQQDADEVAMPDPSSVSAKP